MAPAPLPRHGCGGGEYNRHRLNGHLAQRVSSFFLASSFRNCLTSAVLECMFPWRTRYQLSLVPIKLVPTINTNTGCWFAFHLQVHLKSFALHSQLHPTPPSLTKPLHLDPRECDPLGGPFKHPPQRVASARIPGARPSTIYYSYTHYDYLYYCTCY